MSGLSTLPIFERGRSGQTSTCFGAFTLPIRSLTKRAPHRSPARARPRLQDGDHPLAPLLVGQPDHGAVLHAGMRHQRPLDLGRVDVEAAADDHVLGPVDEVQEVVVVEVADVAGVVPTEPATPRRSRPGPCGSRPSPATCGRRPRRARPAGSSSPSRDMIATVTSGVGRPADDSRSRAIEPSAAKWSAGASVETIIGASDCPNNCPITGPIRVIASASRSAEIGAAPYQRHCSDAQVRGLQRGCASSM